MKTKKTILTSVILIVIITVFLIVYPMIRIDSGERLIVFNYNGDYSKYDVNHSYGELYCYNEEFDVSIKSFEVKRFLFFYSVSMEYIEGDFRETQFVLEEEYINDFLKNAKIIENESSIDISSLIKGKNVIVGNTRYTGNDYTDCILYKLHDKYEEMFVFTVDDLLIIQVGSPDELPKFIAYK